MPAGGCIEIHNKAGFLCPLHATEQKQILKAMLKLSPVTLEAVVLYIVRDDYIASLNNKFLSCQGPTNVLSFPACAMSGVEFEQIPNLLIISVDTLEREAMLYGQDLIEHFIRLMAHGLAHIMGFEHGPEMFALCEEMEMAAQSILDIPYQG